MTREQEEILRRMPKSWLLLREIYLRNLERVRGREDVEKNESK